MHGSIIAKLENHVYMCACTVYMCKSKSKSLIVNYIGIAKDVMTHK